MENAYVFPLTLENSQNAMKIAPYIQIPIMILPKIFAYAIVDTFILIQITHFQDVKKIAQEILIHILMILLKNVFAMLVSLEVSHVVLGNVDLTKGMLMEIPMLSVSVKKDIYLLLQLENVKEIAKKKMNFLFQIVKLLLKMLVSVIYKKDMLENLEHAIFDASN